MPGVWVGLQKSSVHFSREQRRRAFCKVHRILVGVGVRMFEKMKNPYDSSASYVPHLYCCISVHNNPSPVEKKCALTFSLLQVLSYRFAPLFFNHRLPKSSCKGSCDKGSTKQCFCGWLIKLSNLKNKPSKEQD